MSLDVGGARIGVALGDADVRIAMPFETITVDGTEVQQIMELILKHDIGTLVVGYPRNQKGEATQQSSDVEAFVLRLSDIDVNIEYQDESLTSVLAEKRLQEQKKPYKKADIDSEAAAIILQDYLEAHA